MNTKTIQNTAVIKLPLLPKLSSHKCSKVITKHFINAAVYMDRREFCLFTWLIYQSGADNSFRYTTHLLRKYSAAIEAINQEYGGDPLPTSVQLIRREFKKLIENGFILPYDGKVFLLNPMLVVSKKVNVKFYEEFMSLYNVTSENIIPDMVKYWINNFK